MNHKDVLARFDKEFPNPVNVDLTLHGLTTRYRANEDIKSFLTTALDEQAAAILAAAEGVPTETKDANDAVLYKAYNLGRAAVIAAVKEELAKRKIIIE